MPKIFCLLFLLCMLTISSTAKANSFWSVYYTNENETQLFFTVINANTNDPTEIKNIYGSSGPYNNPSEARTECEYMFNHYQKNVPDLNITNECSKIKIIKE